MAQVHLVVGPVGSGKSTYALGLAQRLHAARFNLDEWMTRLFSPDRPERGLVEWYTERAARCVDQIWSVARNLVLLNVNVVLELGLIQRNGRESFYSRIDAEAMELAIHVVDAPREIRRQRVLQRNAERGATFVMLVPPEFFELASDMWEPLSEAERTGREVRFASTPD